MVTVSILFAHADGGYQELVCMAVCMLEGKMFEKWLAKYNLSYAVN